MDACDPNADIANLRQLIKTNIGVDVKLTKDEICQAYEDIQGGKLPLPPLVMNSSRTYLVDKKSPLKPNDYELLFDSTTKRTDLKRIARKVDLKNVDQMTKIQIVGAIGKRLRYMKVHEPVKFARKSRVTVNKYTAVNASTNTAVNNVNNTNLVNNGLNTNRTNNGLNTNRNNGLNTNRNNGLNTNRNNGLNTNRTNTSRNNGFNNSPRASNGARPNVFMRNKTLNNKNVFKQGRKPAFLGGNQRAVREPIVAQVRRNNAPVNVRVNNTPKNKKPGFLGGLFGKKNYIPAKKFSGEKKGYAFKTGNKGLGYYKNNGGPEPTVGPPQGPALPTKNNLKPVPTTLPNGDLTIQNAVAKIKQMGLRREKKFLEKLELGGVAKKVVVAEAELYLEEEKRFLAFVDGLKLLPIESEYIKQRMAVDELQQLRVEAQMKADEGANIERSNEEKMAMFLASTKLSQEDKNAFLARARRGNSNVDNLILEIKKLISNEMNRVLNKKRQEFKNLLKDYNKLSDKDKEDLVKSVSQNTTTNSMKNMAEKLIKKRIEEKKTATAQNLLSFLTPLKINQANKNTFVKRFKNDDVNVNTLKKEALNMEKSRMSGNVENLRVKLNTRLSEIGLNQVNQNVITKKFRNGNMNVEKLIQEAKQLKAMRNAESGNKATQEYISYLGTLANLTNEDRKELLRNGNLNRNKALNLSKKRATEKKERNKKDFIGFLAELGLTNENRTTMINKYNANKLNVEVLKKEAIGLRSGKISEKKAKLLAHMNTLGEVLTSENRGRLLNRVENTNLNTLKANANGIAKKRIGEKQNKERKELEAYINSLGLGVNNKRSILNQNPTLNNGKRLANTKVKERVGQKQNIKNRKNLENYINSLGLNTNDKVNILNKDPNLPEGKRLANNRLQMKIREKRNKNKTALSIYLNKLGLKNTEKNQFLTIMNSPNANVNNIKRRANAFIQNKKTQKQRSNREEFEEYLMQMNLTNEERFQFIDIVTQTNNTDVNSLKRKANTYLSERIKIRRDTMRQELAAYIQGLTNLTNKNKNDIMREFNSTKTNAGILRTRANSIAKQRKNQKNTEDEGAFLNFLDTLTNLTANNKTQISSKLNGYYTDFESLKKAAVDLSVQRAKEKRTKIREELKAYVNEIGLTNKYKARIMKALDNKVANLNTLKTEANRMKDEMDEESRSGKRKNLLRQLTQFNITNENRSELMKQFGNTNNSAIINQAKRVEANRRSTKRDELSLFMSELGLEQNDRNLILKNFDANPKNTTLRNKATKLKKSRNTEDRAKIRSELKEYLNTLNQLNKSNKKKLLANNTMSYNNVKNAANQLQGQKKVISERKKEREELGRYISKLSMLNRTNKKRLMANNTRNTSNIKAEANQLQESKKGAKRAANTNGIKRAMNGLGEEDQLLILNKWETQNVSLGDIIKNVQALKKRRATEKWSINRQDLQDHMNGLNISNTDKQKILKIYNSRKANVTTLKNRATQLNGVTKNKERQRAELSNYIDGLGINGAQLLKKFNDGRSTVNKLKTEANKMRKVANASLVNSKRNQLRTHMKNTRLDDKNKKSFINRVAVDTNMNSLKGEVNNLNTQLKTRDETVAAKKSEISVYVNTLNDLRPENRKTFIAKVVNANTNVDVLKREAATMNGAIKARKVEKERQGEEEKKKMEKKKFEVDKARLGNHLMRLKHLTNPEMEDYMKSFKENGAKIENVIATSTAKDKDNEKDKETLRFYIRNAKIPQLKKNTYLRALLQPHVNITEVKSGVNIDKERERLVGEQLRAQVAKKIQALKMLTPNNRAKLVNSLKNKLPDEVLKEAQKLDAEKRGVRNKSTKNVANQLGKLTDITRNNRVALMKRLPTNGPEKVLANAKKLNQERKTAAKQKEEKGVRNKSTKNVANQLGKLTDITRNNRVALMKRLPTNGPEKVLANAKKLNQERKTAAKQKEEKNKRNTESVGKADLIRKGVEDKFRRINGLTKQDVKDFMEKWNKTKNKRLFDEARKMGAKKAEENNDAAAEASRLFNAGGNVKNLSRGKNDRGVDKELLETVRKFVGFGIGGKRREAFLARGRGMSSTKPLIKEIQERKLLRNKVIADLQRRNDGKMRAQYIDLLEDGDKVWTNVKQTIDRGFKRRAQEMEQKEAQQRKVEEQKKLGEERAKKMREGKAKGDLSKSLSTLKALNRANRTEFIKRLNKGNTASAILRNARKRNSEKGLAASKPNSNPLFAPKNNKVPATNNPLFTLSERKRNQEEAARRGVSVKKAKKNRQMKEKGERAKIRGVEEKKKAAFNNVMKKSNAYVEAKKREEVAKKKAESERALAKSKSNMEARKRSEAQSVRSETERRRLAMLERQKKKNAKAVLRKQNKKLAKATGQGVKATQKKQQATRRRK